MLQISQNYLDFTILFAHTFWVAYSWLRDFVCSQLDLAKATCILVKVFHNLQKLNCFGYILYVFRLIVTLKGNVHCHRIAHKP